MVNENLKFVMPVEFRGGKRKREALIEYYLLESEQVYPEYGLKIRKNEKDNLGNLICKETYISEYISKYKDDAEEVLEILAKNIVTPATAKNVLEDMGII